jgi:hypothetical protein
MSHFTAALERARTLAHVDDIARDLWRAYGAGMIGDGDAERVTAHIEEARLRIRPADTVRARAPGVRLGAVSMFAARRLAYSGPLPPALAAGFTLGQLAVLRIVADEVRAKGTCELALEAIAARAGVCVTLARNAIRLAAGDGLLLIVERRRHGASSLTNVVRIISREWRAWVMHRGGGSKMANPSDNKSFKQRNSRAAETGNAEKRLGEEGEAERRAQAKPATA